jgi:hypothetical protein
MSWVDLTATVTATAVADSARQRMPGTAPPGQTWGDQGDRYAWKAEGRRFNDEQPAW